MSEQARCCFVCGDELEPLTLMGQAVTYAVPTQTPLDICEEDAQAWLNGDPDIATLIKAKADEARSKN